VRQLYRTPAAARTSSPVQLPTIRPLYSWEASSPQQQSPTPPKQRPVAQVTAQLRRPPTYEQTMYSRNGPTSPAAAASERAATDSCITARERISSALARHAAAKEQQHQQQQQQFICPPRQHALLSTTSTSYLKQSSPPMRTGGVLASPLRSSTLEHRPSLPVNPPPSLQPRTPVQRVAAPRRPMGIRRKTLTGGIDLPSPGQSTASPPPPSLPRRPVEINWSVNELRSLFDHSAGDVDTANYPVLRPPPLATPTSSAQSARMRLKPIPTGWSGGSDSPLHSSLVHSIANTFERLRTNESYV
jgi:hypothetical protein